MPIRTSLNNQAEETLKQLISVLGLDANDRNVNSQAVKIAMQIVQVNIDENTTTIKYLQGREQGLSLTQTQRKYKVNYKTLQKLDEKFNNYDN